MKQSVTSMLLIKLHHSHKVAEYCEQLSTHLGWNKVDIETVMLLGYLHDYGSLLEILETNSFVHKHDHGFEGYWKFHNSEFNKILTIDQLAAIRYHNNPNLMELHNKFLKVLRDADKLAIFEFTNSLINTGELEWHCETYLECKTTDYCKAMLGWFGDINYSWTERKLSDMKIRERLEVILG